MIKRLKLNADKTYEIYLKSKDIIENGLCYNNCINILAKVLLEDYQKEKYKIGYCYVGGENHLLVRHCIIVTKDNEVIDVSALLKYDYDELVKVTELNNIEYFVFAELNCTSLYLTLNREDDPSLKNTLKNRENELYDFAVKLGLEFNEHDYNKYIRS